MHITRQGDKMSNRSFFFPQIDKLSQYIAQLFYEKKFSLNKVGVFLLIAGFLAPFPLLFVDSWFRFISPVIMLLFVVLDYSLSYLEAKLHQRHILNSLISFPIAVLVFLWYELILCEVVYNIADLWIIRYFNLFSISCAVSGLLIIYGYLKLNDQPMSIYRFAEQLIDFGRKNEKEIPFNYIILTFKILKEDLLVIVLLILSLFNIYLLYFAITFTSIGFLIFTIYTLFLMKLVNEGTGSDDTN